MLNSETKRKIDSARDILVGKVTNPIAQVDQITNALIYKFMDDMDQENIEVGFCKERNKITLKIIGKKPIDIYQTIINKEKLPIRKDHAAYLGRELQKAYMALKNNLKYVQDEELDLKKKA